MSLRSLFISIKPFSCCSCNLFLLSGTAFIRLASSCCFIFKCFISDLDIDTGLWKKIETAFEKRDNLALMEGLLKLNLFPVKDSYVAYLKRDKGASERNPATIARLCGRVYEMGLDTVFSRCSEPKETNRQIGPLFRRWLNKKSLGIQPIKMKEFLATNENAILDAGDKEMMDFAKKYLYLSSGKFGVIISFSPEVDFCPEPPPTGD